MLLSRSNPREIWLPIGGSLALGVFTNLFGDANGMIRRDVFKKLGGFTEDSGITHEDWEFYASAALANYSMTVVPKPLFWYRVHPSSMLRSTNQYLNHMRSMRPYLQKFGPQLTQALLLAQALYLTPPEIAPPALDSTPAPSPAQNRA